MCEHCEWVARFECNPNDEDCLNFNPEENGTLPTDPFDAISYRSAA